MTLYLQSSWRESLDPFYQAHREDSTFALALLFAAVNHFNLGEWGTTDSLIDVVSRSDHRLSEYYRARVDYFRALLDGKNELALAANRRQAQLAPGTKAVYNRAIAANRVNRRQEALDALKTLDPERAPMKGWLPYWGQTVNALHGLGLYEEEREAAQRAQELHPGHIGPLAFEAMAVAALGHVQDLDGLVERAASFERRLGWTPGVIMVNAANELRAHGHVDAARRLLDQALEWYETRPSDEAASQPHRNMHAYALYNMGRWGDAANAYEALARDFPDNLAYQGYMVVTRTKRGDSSQEQVLDEWLRAHDDPYRNGDGTWWKALSAAAHGEHGQCVDLLRQALNEGVNYGRWMHTELLLAELKDYPAFQELMHPKN
jgi:tetratricopeptide (TPR) repeat protein